MNHTQLSLNSNKSHFSTKTDDLGVSFSVVVPPSLPLFMLFSLGTASVTVILHILLQHTVRLIYCMCCCCTAHTVPLYVMLLHILLLYSIYYNYCYNTTAAACPLSKRAGPCSDLALNAVIKERSLNTAGL